MTTTARYVVGTLHCHGCGHRQSAIWPAASDVLEQECERCGRMAAVIATAVSIETWPAMAARLEPKLLEEQRVERAKRAKES